MSIVINEAIDPNKSVGLQVYARCRVSTQNGRGTRVFYGKLLKHKVLNLWKLVEGDKTAGWFDRDDVIAISDKPGVV